MVFACSLFNGKTVQFSLAIYNFSQVHDETAESSFIEITELQSLAE